VRVGEFDLLVEAHLLHHPVREADRLENPQDLVVGRDRPRHLVRAGLVLEARHADPTQAELLGGHLANRAETRDDDIDLGWWALSAAMRRPNLLCIHRGL
jgi:hypothetical protein